MIVTPEVFCEAKDASNLFSARTPPVTTKCNQIITVYRRKARLVYAVLGRALL